MIEVQRFDEDLQVSFLHCFSANAVVLALATCATEAQSQCNGTSCIVTLSKSSTSSDFEANPCVLVVPRDSDVDVHWVFSGLPGYGFKARGLHRDGFLLKGIDYGHSYIGYCNPVDDESSTALRVSGPVLYCFMKSSADDSQIDYGIRFSDSSSPSQHHTIDPTIVNSGRKFTCPVIVRHAKSPKLIGARPERRKMPAKD